MIEGRTDLPHLKKKSRRTFTEYLVTGRGSRIAGTDYNGKTKISQRKWN
jgi:hypothetical protein